MALLTLPTVVVARRRALRAIPQSYREVAYSLRRDALADDSTCGSASGRRRNSHRRHSGRQRGSGEVAPVMFTGAAYFLPELPPASTISSWSWATMSTS